MIAILETALYAPDLDAIETFYRQVFRLEPLSKLPGRHIFYQLGNQMLLYFNPSATEVAAIEGNSLPVPAHGTRGPGHLCFRADHNQIKAWRTTLEGCGVAIEAEFIWPQGGRSLYFRDPAGNSLEFAEPRIWGLPG